MELFAESKATAGEALSSLDYRQRMRLQWLPKDWMTDKSHIIRHRRGAKSLHASLPFGFSWNALNPVSQPKGEKKRTSQKNLRWQMKSTGLIAVWGWLCGWAKESKRMFEKHHMRFWKRQIHRNYKFHYLYFGPIRKILNIAVIDRSCCSSIWFTSESPVFYDFVWFFF